MQKTSNLQIIVLGVFIFFSIIGVVFFAGFFGTGGDNALLGDETIELWGVLPENYVKRVIDESNSGQDPTIKINYTEKSLSTIQTEYDQSIINQNPPDALLIPESLLISNQKKLYLLPWKTFPERDFKDTFIDGGEVFTTTEGFYGFPVLVDPLVTYWNRDIFATNGIARAPKNWDEVSQILPRIAKISDDKTIQKSFVALGSYQNVKNAKDILMSLIIQAGSKAIIRKNNELGSLYNAFSQSVLVEDDTNDVNNANSVLYTPLSFYLQFSNPSNPMYSWNSSLQDSLSLFLKQDLAMYFGFGSEYNSIISKNPNLNFDISPFPQPTEAESKKAIGRIYGIMITRDSQRKQSVYNQMIKITSPEVMKSLAQYTGLAPARRDLITTIPDSASNTAIWTSALYTRGWLDPDPNVTEKLFKDMIESSLSGRSLVTDAVLNFGKQINELIKGK